MITRSPKEGIRRFVEKFSTLRFQVLGIVITSVLVPSFLGGWFASNRINDLLKERVYSQIETGTEGLARQLDEWLKDRSSEVQAFTVSYLLREDLKKLQRSSTGKQAGNSRENISSYLSYLLEGNNFFSGITILNEDGTVLLTQPAGSWKIKGNIRSATETNTFIREFATSEGNQLIVARKIDLGGGLKPVTFAALMNIEHLGSRIMDLAPKGSVVYLTDQKGNIKTGNIKVKNGSKCPDGALPLIQKKEKISTYEGLKGNEVIATSSQLEEPSWAVVLETSRSEALKPLGTFRRQVIFMALGLAAIFLIPALVLARALVLPLEELNVVSRRIRGGKPGLQVKSRIKGELGDLIDSFNSMSISLKDSLEEITTKNEELLFMSITDPLTGRYNRRYIEDYLQRELDLALRTKDPLTILMIDLDHFKGYNDTYGHIAGDLALKQLGDILVQTVRKTDVVARFGGEEWIVCLSHTDKKGGAKIAEKLRKAVEETVFKPKDQETRITVSVGLATTPEDGTEYEAIVEAADKAMYTAKDRGRNQIQIFSESGSS